MHQKNFLTGIDILHATDTVRGKIFFPALVINYSSWNSTSFPKATKRALIPGKNPLFTRVTNKIVGNSGKKNSNKSSDNYKSKMRHFDT